MNIIIWKLLCDVIFTAYQNVIVFVMSWLLSITTKGKKINVRHFYSQSTPESWAQFTHDNITRAEHERMASIQLRTLIDNVLLDTSRDMREQADAVDVAFQKRVDEVQDAKNKMEENLKKVCEVHFFLWMSMVNTE